MDSDKKTEKRKRGTLRATPLFMASLRGNVYRVKMLIEEGADINKAANDGVTPLLIASHMGHVEVVEVLVEKGADINKAANNGVTPLFIASLKGHQEIVHILKPYIQIPRMTEEEFETCEKTCAITYEPLNKENAVKPPSENNTCFKHSALQEWLKIKQTHPITRERIDVKWINKWYPLGINGNYDDMYDWQKTIMRYI